MLAETITKGPDKRKQYLGHETRKPGSCRGEAQTTYKEVRLEKRDKPRRCN